MPTSHDGAPGPEPPTDPGPPGPPSAGTPVVVVIPGEASHVAAARALAARLGCPLGTRASGPGSSVAVTRAGRADPGDGRAAPDTLAGAWRLLVDDAGRTLQPPARPHGGRSRLRVDWAGPLAREVLRPGAARRLALARAAGADLAGRLVLDATAGLGRDAFRLAMLGADVVAAERSPLLLALLEDGLRRALADPVVGGRLEGRLRLHAGDAHELLARGPAPDVVLIDPMYPDAGRSALPRGEMQVLRRLLGPDHDADGLLAAALAAARRRVVVKRHAHDAPLAGRAPAHRVTGRSTRFDVYLAGPAPTDA